MRKKNILKVFCAAILFTVFLTWPFTKNIFNYYTDRGDYPFNGWVLWYNYNALKSGDIFNREKYFNSPQFFPLPNTLAYSDNQIIPSLIFFPLYQITNKLNFSVNLFTLLTFIFTFISAYYCIHLITKENLSSLIGAFIFTFNPVTFAHFPVHLQLLYKFFLPPVFITFFNYIKLPKYSTGFWFFVLLLLNALTNIYYQLLIFLILPFIFIPYFLYIIHRRNWQYFKQLFISTLIGIPFLIFLIYWNYPYIKFSQQESAVRSIEDNVHNSARNLDWITSLPGNYLYGPLTQKIDPFRRNLEYEQEINYAERTLFINIFPLFLCFLGIFFLVKRNRQNRLLLISGLLIMGFCFILTFGPVYLGNNSIRSSIKLPYYYIYRFTSLLDGLRAPTRFQFIFYLPFSVFSAFGVLYLLQISRNKTSVKFKVILSFIILLLVIENINKFDFSENSEILKQTSELKQNQPQIFNALNEAVTLHIPANYYSDLQYYSRYNTWATQSKEKLVNGYSGFFPEDWRKFLKNQQDNLISGNLDSIRAIGVDFLILHKDTKPNLWTSQPLLKEIYKNLVYYDDDKILILDLQSLNPSQCKYRDFQIITSPVISEELNVISYKIQLGNQQNCYQINDFQNRYLFASEIIDNRQNEFYIILPPVLAPFQKYQTERSFAYKGKFTLKFAPKKYKLHINIPQQNFSSDLEIYPTAY